MLRRALQRPSRARRKRHDQPNFEKLAKQLANNKHLTRRKLRMDYDAAPAGEGESKYQYSQMRKLQNLDALILDDFLATGIDQHGQEDLTKIIFDRDGRLPAIIVS